MTENYKLIEDLARCDAAALVEKGKAYGDSWKRRGGVGAFMMLARKWDRIENIVKDHGWDVFSAAGVNTSDIIDDIEDLRRYLLLVQAHVRSEVRFPPNAPGEVKTNYPSHCQVCGSPGNHAGMICPHSIRPAQSASPWAGVPVPPIKAPQKHLQQCSECNTMPCECVPEVMYTAEPRGLGYVDQDHDPYSRK